MSQEKIVPLISSGVAGPLGVLHLPRFWQKVSLEAVDRLADGYPACGAGYDENVLIKIGIDPKAAVTYIKENLPSEPEFERWIEAQDGVKLDKATKASTNKFVEGYIHADETRQPILAAEEIPDDEDAPQDAVNLNNLDDWRGFYESVIKSAKE